MERVTWEWIAAGLDEAFGFCREIGLGLQVERSRRFREHRACVAELTGALQAGDRRQPGTSSIAIVCGPSPR